MYCTCVWNCVVKYPMQAQVIGAFRNTRLSCFKVHTLCTCLWGIYVTAFMWYLRTAILCFKEYFWLENLRVTGDNSSNWICLPSLGVASCKLLVSCTLTRKDNDQRCRHLCVIVTVLLELNFSKFFIRRVTHYLNSFWIHPVNYKSCI